MQGVDSLKSYEYSCSLNPSKSQYASILEEPIDDLNVIIMIAGVNLNDGEP